MKELCDCFKVIGRVLTYDGPYPKTLEEAMAISIEKWTQIVAWYEDNNTRLVDGSDETCGLCMRFIYTMSACANCPIREHTGETYCHNTPYYDYTDAYDLDALRRLAQEELDLLLKLKEEM